MKPVAIRHWLISLGLVALTIVPLAQLAGADFINFDDSLYIADNPFVLSGLSWDNLAWAFTTFHATNWHPLTWLSLQLDVQLFGPSPAVFHLVNLAWHTANVLLLFAVLQGTTGAPWSSALVAALFAVHPLHVESVAWVSERKDVLCAFFGLVTIWLYAAYAARPTWKRYLGVAAAFALGLLAKPMLVTWPFVLLLLDVWPLGRWGRVTGADTQPAAACGPSRVSRPTLLLEKVPLLLLAVGSCVLTVQAQYRGGAVSTFLDIPLQTRVINALVAYALYLHKTFWPVGLAIFYPYLYTSITTAQISLSIGALLGVTALALRVRKMHPQQLIGWLWFLGTLVPVIGLVQVGEQALADRYMYLPSIGLAIMVVWGGRALAERTHVPGVLRTAACGLVLACLGVLTWVQAGYWRNSFTLFSHTLAVTRNNYLAHRSLGAYYLQQEEFAKAARHLIEARKLQPDFAPNHLLLGMAYEGQGHREAAAACYREVLRLDPGNTEAHERLQRLQSRLP